VTKETDAHRFVTNELDGFLGSNFLVTYHDQQFRSISSLDAVIDSAPHTISRGADFLLHKILDQMIDAYIPVVEDFDDSIGGLEDDIFEAKDGNTEILEEVMRLKRSVGRLIRISTKQTSVLHRLASSEFTQISSEATPFLRDVCDHLQRIATLAESHRDLISSLMDVHLSVISNKTNDIMKLLAIFSAVMLPLSLIAGIYGMNIKSLPDDQHPDAFWHLMLVMAAIGIALMFYFWRKGWIKGFDRGKSAVAVRKSDSPDS
jgi:magnesium transporter